MKTMKRTLLNLAIALVAQATVATAQAQTQAPQAPFRFLVGMGLTAGGDKLASVTYTNNTSQNLHAGGLVHFYAGGEYRFTPAFSMQANIGYHVDQANGSNGDMKFARYPLEILGHYYLNDQWRLGGGVRFVSSAKLSGSGAASIPDVDFGSTTGGVIEGEYLLSSHLGFKLRYVSESYKLPSGLTLNGKSSADGSHVGLYMTGYF